VAQLAAAAVTEEDDVGFQIRTPVGNQ